MNFIQTFIGAFIFVGALMILFLFAWYIALPALILLMCLWGAVVLQNKIAAAFRRMRAPKESVIHMRRTETKTPSSHTVIDVEYTEVE